VADEQQPNRGIPSASEMSHYGGMPYTPPDRVEHADAVRDSAPLSGAGRAWRLALAALLAALAVVDIVRFVVLLTAAHPSVAGLVGSAVLALLFLAYPVILLSRGRRLRS
jgi:hypothetical protein